MLRRRHWLALATVSTCGAWLAPARADDDYGLDEVSRDIPAHGRVPCPDVELVTYRGKHIKYRQAAKVYAGFATRLARFEKIAAELAEQTYGRKPSRLVHMGTFNCRRIKTYPTWLSEHGLGNAIDLEGFDFPALKKGQSLPEGVHRAFRGAFGVRVHPHWKQRAGIAKVHATFLRELAKRTIARKDVFRVLLGPHYPGHHNHFHFDCAPWRIVDGFRE